MSSHQSDFVTKLRAEHIASQTAPVGRCEYYPIPVGEYHGEGHERICVNTKSKRWVTIDLLAHGSWTHGHLNVNHVKQLIAQLTDWLEAQ